MTNLVTNPGAETGTMSGWSAGAWSATSSTPHSGSYAFFTGSSSTTIMSQVISLVSGNSYSMSLWVKCADYAGTGSGTQCNLNLNVDDNTLMSFSSSDGSITNSYTYHYVNFIASSSSQTLEINGYSPPSFVYVDDIVLELTNLVTNPGAEIGSMSSWTSTGWNICTPSYTGTYEFCITSNTNNQMSQSLELIPGINYIVSFYAAGYGGYSNSVSLSLDGNIIISLTNVGYPYASYRALFTSDNSDADLEIIGTGTAVSTPTGYTSYLVIDDITVTSTSLTAPPTSTPTLTPTAKPTYSPTSPTFKPTKFPTNIPSKKPTNFPTSPTKKPTLMPSTTPSVEPTDSPTFSPTVKPTFSPTAVPSVKPTSVPTSNPTIKPTKIPTLHPTAEPTKLPTQAPTLAPTTIYLNQLTNGEDSKGFVVYGEDENSQFGFSVSEGTLSNNARSTAIVSAPYYNSTDYNGYVSTYLDKDNAPISYTAQDSTNFGYSIANAGNFNNNADGFDSVIVGAPGTNNNVGSAYIYSNNQLILTVKGVNSSNTTFIGDRMGHSVSGIGDFNGDKIPDVIIGAPYANKGYGVSYVIFGNQTYTSTSPGIIDLAFLTVSEGIVLYGQSFKGNTTDSEESVPTTGSGWSVSGGDLDNDGLTDVVIGEPLYKNNQGRICIVFGTQSPTNINLITSLNVNCKLVGTSTDSQYSHVGSLYGFSVSIGDVNNDGNNDIAIGAPEASTVSSTGKIIQSSGKTQIIYGSGNNAIKTLAAEDSPNGFNIYGNIPDSFSGWSVAVTNDVNGDDINDIIIGAPGFSNSSIGYAYVIYGLQTSSRELVILSSNFPINTGFTCIGGYPGDGTGYAVKGVGDINGDTLFDIIIGAPRTDANTGAAYVVYGFQQHTEQTTNLVRIETTVQSTNLAQIQTYPQTLISTPSITLSIGGTNCKFSNFESSYTTTPYSCLYRPSSANSRLKITASTSNNQALYLDDIAVTFENVPTNPGAEEGMNNWVSSIGWRAYPGSAHSGSYSFSLSVPYDRNNYMEQALPTILTPGISYLATFYAKVTNVVVSASITLSVGGTDCKFSNFESYYTSTPYMCHFTADRTNVRLKITASTSNNQALYLDDIAITLKAVPINSGAEERMNGWESTGWISYPSHAHSGSYSFSLSMPYNSNNYMQQTIGSLAPGINHLITFYAKEPNGHSIPIPANLVQNWNAELYATTIEPWQHGKLERTKYERFGKWEVSNSIADSYGGSHHSFVLNGESTTVPNILTTTASITQTISVTIGATYTISFWAKAMGVGTAKIKLKFEGINRCLGSQAIGEEVWVKSLYTRTVYTCISDLSNGRVFTIIGKASQNLKLFIDNIVVEQSASSRLANSFINTIEEQFSDRSFNSNNNIRNENNLLSIITKSMVVANTHSMYIINGGKHYITSSNGHYIIDSPINITIVGKNSHNNVYTFLPQPNVYAKLTDFNVNDKIDLSVYEGVYDIKQLKITNGIANENVNIVEDYYSYYTYYAYYGEISGEADSAVITLDNGQTIELFNISPEDLTSDNFVFAQSPAPTMAPVYFTPESTSTSSSELSMEIIIGVTLGGVVLLSAVGYIVYAYFNNYCPFSLFKSVPSQDIADATVKITNQLETEVITKQLEEGAAAHHTYDTLQQQGLELTGIGMEEVL